MNRWWGGRGGTGRNREVLEGAGRREQAGGTGGTRRSREGVLGVAGKEVLGEADRMCLDEEGGRTRAAGVGRSREE